MVVITNYILIMGHIYTCVKNHSYNTYTHVQKKDSKHCLGLWTSTDSIFFKHVWIGQYLCSAISGIVVFQEASSISMIWHLVWVRSKDIYIFIKTGATECHVSSISTRRKKLPATHSTLKFESYPTHVHIETDHSHTSRC